MNCPCKTCICIPVCRNKRFYELLNDCELLSEYDNDIFHAANRDWIKTRRIFNILNPVLWTLDFDIEGRASFTSMRSTDGCGLGGMKNERAFKKYNRCYGRGK